MNLQRVLAGVIIAIAGIVGYTMGISMENNAWGWGVFLIGTIIAGILHNKAEKDEKNKD